MHGRPSAAAAPLSALSLPPRPREMNALISGSGSMPHTPTKRAEPLPLFSTNTNRYSTDSWNSSNFDATSEIEPEWKPDHIRLLQRTLDALPSHLLTPFNGPVPPSNLLDKIARGVADAKGNNWQHSMRATRAKIVELARVRAKESRDGSGSDTIAEEDSTDGAPLQQTTNIGLKRPLYRQSSMDFMQQAKADLKDNSNISRLSRRLQKTERILTSPTYSHYAHPSSPTRGPLSLMPSAPSSMTLSSSISEIRPSAFRDSISSIESNEHLVVATRRVRRSEISTGHSVKRAPSFGSSRNSLESVAMSIDFNAKNSDATSSDEEEKLRNQHAKRARHKAASPTLASPLASPTPTSSNKRARIAPRTPSKASTKTIPAGQSDAQTQSRASRPRVNLERNPSILGPELPNPQRTPQSPVVNRSRPSTNTVLRRPASSAVYDAVPASPYNLTSIPPVTPTSHKASRRSRQAVPLPRASLARKISFGSLVSQHEETGGGSGAGLDSAFQLH
ncbi:uncharacterized protein PHACADRAFT_252616 [Phanerochaete carnosa HHB-10118-sp]|uniref:Uncharacterized protein n=1 Tax=Phanerochaete carnosa (strain HHB-10118-sp) TaxID=650164 RepID=K5WH01_PHACS|nr:uncharacterized protein PHACADRAFT_252616 [Phanerochaete carnosa HHB-10118-sp]EKM58359.1 hypothetical protein PHACADRAFT_252616 [Phanerochaete carnosa HHB-10118-sp]